MQAFIFAAGLGTRLQPLTLTMPKALVPIDGKPLIDMVLSKFIDAGISDFIVNIHHFPEQIKEHLKQRTDIRIQFSDESDLLRETGGAIRHASNLFDKRQPFVVHNVDIISNLDINKFINAHRIDSVATLLVSKRKTQRYLLFDKDMRLVGWMNESTGEVKPKNRGIDPAKYDKYAFAGAHVVDYKLVELMKNYEEKFSIIDFYLAVAEEYPIYGYVQSDLQMVDVGKFDSLSEAENRVKQILNKEL